MHFFLCALVDDSADVATLAQHVLLNTVAAKVHSCNFACVNRCGHSGSA